jgi:hypothetical protein
MTYGYDADISPQFGTNLIRIKSLAAAFLGSLVNERQEDNVRCTLELGWVLEMQRILGITSLRNWRGR